MGLFIGDAQPSKIFVGDTPISKVFLGDTQVRPTGWQPGANTLLYLPLNGDLLDRSGNGNNGTAIGTISFQTIGSKQFAYFNPNSAIQLQTIPIGSGNPQAFTQVAWLKTNSNGVGYMHHFGNDANHSRSCLIVFYSGNKRPLQDLYGSGWDTYLGPASNSSLWDTRICVGYTYNNGTHKLYISGQLYGTGTNQINIGGTNNRYIGRKDGTGGYAMSECIFERGERTAQKMLDYYNLTKDNYPATLNSLQNINLTPTNEINIAPNNNGSGNVQSI